MTPRYDYCPDVDGTWAVLDLISGDPAVVAGVEMVRMRLERAERVTELLNVRAARRRQGAG